jgi:hypothetical protein
VVISEAISMIFMMVTERNGVGGDNGYSAMVTMADVKRTMVTVQ